MFNLLRIEPAFTDDEYGFTQSLLAYINGDSNFITEMEKLGVILEHAYDRHSASDQKIVQHALFLIYQSVLAHPLSIPAARQYDPAIIEIKNAIEQKWLESEFSGLVIPPEVDSVEHYGDYLKSVWQAHNASHHQVFEFLEKDATTKQLYYFFKSDCALNLIFFDLVAYTLIGSQPETRGTISENLWDEIGHGDNVFTHVNLYKDVLARQDITLPGNHYIDMYSVEALAGHNAFMIGSVNRKHYYKLLGVMAMTEVLDPPQYEKLVKGCIRLGLVDRDVKYYTEHITIDIKHGDDWLYNVIDVIANKYPETRKEFYIGSLLRLRTAERYYDQLMNNLDSIV
ncbi:iron-containing redox enzyme family protein [Klebsiella aerogenes]|uniref:iron-containing redox enzyme family protein n=1 Tax=Klebsiella aerogenes TaxID=548 RepID=UPI001CFBFBBA|nr:iron-containing redox enzyme family protein [Klebsiella aerogenes]EKV3450925.1 iron-containing redox enzyme family protein [Klebsiella aerogenes]ELW9553201.1 iron-containing redox enzyme family protein [Klebsiella aerogenes]EMF0803286.1 iron-containing redox enzyme family protein [Klebsiella aerogenes]MCB4376250.1 iron-containing redox enzyme family protein [Klebsiella aerogenes]HBV9990791.1 iron-containing redox enzyme family protein [Klebsiella aerogenes]